LYAPAWPCTRQPGPVRASLALYAPAWPCTRQPGLIDYIALSLCRLSFPTGGSLGSGPEKLGRWISEWPPVNRWAFWVPPIGSTLARKFGRFRGKLSILDLREAFTTLGGGKGRKVPENRAPRGSRPKARIILTRIRLPARGRNRIGGLFEDFRGWSREGPPMLETAEGPKAVGVHQCLTVWSLIRIESPLTRS